MIFWFSLADFFFVVLREKLGNGFIDFGWDDFSDVEKTYKQGIEINNGRAAMMGILALMVHEELGVSLWPGGI